MESGASAIVTLGTITEHGLLKLLAEQGLNLRIPDRPDIRPPAMDRPVTEYASKMKLGAWLSDGGWWEASGVVGDRYRAWRILPVYHPSRLNGLDRGYRRTIPAVKSMMAGASVAQTA